MANKKVGHVVIFTFGFPDFTVGGVSRIHEGPGWRFTPGSAPEVTAFFSEKTQGFHGFNRRILKEDAKEKKKKDHQHMNSPRNKKNTFLGYSAGDLFGMVKSQHQHGHGENETLLKVAKRDL